MIKRSFFSLTKPQVEYESPDQVPTSCEKMKVPKTAILLFPKANSQQNSMQFKVGDRLLTGQKVSLFTNDDNYIISSVTGKISGFSSFIGDYGKSYTAISVDTEEKDEFDETFAEFSKSLSLDTATKFLQNIPGCPSWKGFSNPDKPIDTVVVCGADRDMLVASNQYVIKSQIEAINQGISTLKKIINAQYVIIALPEGLIQAAGSVGGASGVEIRSISSAYPSAFSEFVIRNVVGKDMPADKTNEDVGVSIFTAEAVASIGNAVRTNRIPVTKTLTLIKKDLSKVIVQARIGTRIGDVLEAFEVAVNDKDRIIVGGPMSGAAIYTLDYPVCIDTDAIMVQDTNDIPAISDYPCINCGECIRICPTHVPVDMLVRYLEARRYEEAAEQYDLYSCIECGLCSVVCVSKMPIMQYIKLAKYELEQIRAAEATHV